MSSASWNERIGQIKNKAALRKNYSKENNRTPNDRRFHAGEGTRLLPKIFANSALFTARSKRKKRNTYHQTDIFSMGKQIQFSGQELRVYDDLVIWLQLLHITRVSDLGTPIKFKLYQICRALGWHTTGENYDRISKSIWRLHNTRLTIIDNQNTLIEIVPIRLVTEVEVIEKQYSVLLGKDLYRLFENTDFARLHWPIYLNLTPIAKKIYAYVSNHKFPHPLRLDTFKNLIGSETSSETKFKQQIKNAIGELLSENLLKSGLIEKSSDHFLVTLRK